MAKLWRKMSRKERTGEFDAVHDVNGNVIGHTERIQRTGRSIKQIAAMQEYVLRKAAKSTTLLDNLFARAPLNQVPLTNAEFAALRAKAEQMIDDVKAEAANEAK